MAGIRARLAGLTPRPFGIVHLVWLILILAGCVAPGWGLALIAALSGIAVYVLRSQRIRSVLR